MQIDPMEIIRQLGYDHQKLDPYIRDIIANMVDTTYLLAEPSGGYSTHDIENIDMVNGILKASGTRFHVGKIIASQLREAEKLVLFAATLGPRVEQKCEEHFRAGNNLEGYVLNLAASEAAEGLAESVHQYVREAAQKQVMKTTNRFSPGYCNWDVSEQVDLFRMLPGNKCGIMLTESALMYPIKSVSGIIGVGRKARYRNYTCSMCDDDKCLYRKESLRQGSLRN